MKSSKDNLESQLKVCTEQLTLIQKSHDDLTAKRHTENELMSKEINLAGIKERDLKNKMAAIERELGEIKDTARLTQQELDVRTKENDHLVSLLED